MTEELHYGGLVNELLDSKDLYKSVTDRYFTKRYCVDVNGTIGNDHLLLFHSNKICLVALAPSHPVFREFSYRIDFKVGNLDRTKNKVSGKGKKGGQHLENNSIICRIKGHSGTVYDVQSCIKGKLIEINDNLVRDYKAFNNQHLEYIAVVLSHIEISNNRKDELLTEEDYLNVLQKRNTETISTNE